jgi:uncharacterized protein DUF2190
MATEAPLIRDGAQTVAAANYYNPGTALYGPGGSGQFLCVYLSGARTVTLGPASNGGVIYGILQNTPDIGQAADVALFGITKAVSQAAISAGAPVMAEGTNGRVMPWVSTAGNVIIGYALEAATAANAILTILLFPRATAGF